jgi:hypothetical protein
MNIAGIKPLIAANRGLRQIQLLVARTDIPWTAFTRPRPTADIKRGQT